MTDLFDSNGWQCHPASPGPRRAAGILEAGAAGELTGRHAPARQGGPGEQSTRSGQVWPGSPKQLSQSSGWGRGVEPFPVPPSIVPHCLIPPPSQQIHNIRQHSSTGPPPLLLAPRASVPSVQIQGQRIIQQGLIRVANVPNTSLLVNIPQVRAVLCQCEECALQLPPKRPIVLGHSGVVQHDLPAP